MLKKATFMTTLILLIGFSQAGTASCYIQELISEVHLNAYYCVKSYDEGKIYIDPESIYIDKNGAHLLVNDETSYVLPYLLSDANGCYLWDEFAGTGIPSFPFVHCSKCGYDHAPPPHK